MNTKIFILSVLGFIFVSSIANATEDEIDLKIISVANFANSTGMEVCGTAVHSGGATPIMVTLKHDESFYTTLTAENGVWCQLIKRWKFNGAVEATAKPLFPANAKSVSIKAKLFPAKGSH